MHFECKFDKLGQMVNSGLHPEWRMHLLGKELLVAMTVPLSAAERARILDLYKAGTKLASIMAVTGRSRSSVYSVINAAGAKHRNVTAATSVGSCEVCGQPVRYIPPSLHATGIGRYCSRKCMGDARRLPPSRAAHTANELLCTRCREMKSPDEFYPHGATARGRQYWCKACYRESRAERARQPPDSMSIRRWRLQAQYGISPAEYDALYQKQSGRCAVCAVEKESWEPDAGVKGRHRFLVVDHDHRTGCVRGLLCFNCNAGIGQFHDDPRVMLAAIAYMETVQAVAPG